MIIQEFSDLHFEKHRDAGRQFVESLDPSPADLLILAGDIYPWALDEERKTFKRLCKRYPKVLYVPGNHEFYGFDIDARFRYQADLLLDIPNLYIPLNVPIVINDVRFCCTTLWFKESIDDFLWHSRYGDFDSIAGFTPWVYEQNRLAVEFLEHEVRTDDVVVTHFLPSYESVDTRYIGSKLNRFYVSDQCALIVDRQPRLWFHGHAHAQKDYHIGPTRIYANPLGYPYESESVWRFRDRDLIEI